MTDQPIKILVVEDEMIIGAKVSLFLSELGYEVAGILPRAEEALLQIEENRPDIALLDINLKGSMDGIALAQVLQTEHNIPVVFLTANSDDATFQRAKATKPYAFLAKPFKKNRPTAGVRIDHQPLGQPARHRIAHAKSRRRSALHPFRPHLCAQQRPNGQNPLRSHPLH